MQGVERGAAGQFVVHTLAATVGTLIVYVLLIAVAGKVFAGWQPGFVSNAIICSITGLCSPTRY